jgi:hypothetical protein
MKWINGWSAAATFEGEFSNVTTSFVAAPRHIRGKSATSVPGTKRTCRRNLVMSAIEGWTDLAVPSVPSLACLDCRAGADCAIRERGYAVFHSGPSATADIEGVLILEALAFSFAGAQEFGRA